jgi:hypothetical protein
MLWYWYLQQVSPLIQTLLMAMPHAHSHFGQLTSLSPDLGLAYEIGLQSECQPLCCNVAIPMTSEEVVVKQPHCCQPLWNCCAAIQYPSDGVDPLGKTAPKLMADLELTDALELLSVPRLATYALVLMLLLFHY